MAITDVKMFAFSAAVLYTKFLICTMIQGRKAFAAGTRTPEDSQLPQAKSAPKQGFADLTDDHVRSAIEDEMRWKRIVQNDLESMPMAFVVFWSAISVDVNANLTKTLLLIYTIARIGHSVVYCQSWPRVRMLCWLIGVGCIIVGAMASFLSALMSSQNYHIKVVTTRPRTETRCIVPDLDQAEVEASVLTRVLSVYFPNSAPRVKSLLFIMLSVLSDVNAFGLAAAVLYVKFLGTSMIQARKSFAANTRAPEDRQLVCAMGLSSNMDEKTLKVALENEQRWRRIVQNDLESIPLALLVFWGAIQNGVSSNLIKTLLVVYTTARIGHTVTYGMGAARSRMACWLSGTACVLTAAANIAMIVFT